MKLLLDGNLSPRLVTRLASLFPDLTHVRDHGLKQASDQEIWGFARNNACTILTSDADLVALSERLGWPPKVIHIEQCDFPLRVIEDLLRRNALRITEFVRHKHSGVLKLRLTLDKS